MTPETYSFKEKYFEVNIKTGKIARLNVAKKKYSWDYDGSIKFKSKQSKGNIMVI